MLWTLEGLHLNQQRSNLISVQIVSSVVNQPHLEERERVSGQNSGSEGQYSGSVSIKR